MCNAVQARMELTFVLDAAIRLFRGGVEPSHELQSLSKTFWISHFEKNGVATTECFGFVSELQSHLPKHDLLVKENCGYYGLGITVLRYKKEEQKYLVASNHTMGQEEELLSEQEAIATLKSWRNDRLVQRFVVPLSHLGTHTVRITTARLGDDPVFVSGKLSFSWSWLAWHE